MKASQPRLPPPVATAAAAGAGNRGAAPPAGPMDLDSPKSPAGRKRGGRKEPASPGAAQPLSPTSPTAAEAAAAALAQAADRSGEASTSGRELVPLPEQLQEAVEAAMASGGLLVWFTLEWHCSAVGGRQILHCAGLWSQLCVAAC